MGATTATDWKISGEEVGHCNCDWGCPCQFNANPTHGQCHALIGFRIDEGHFGDVSLDGAKYAWVVWWPGPIHEGNGHLQLILDEASSDEQREAITQICSGEQGGVLFEIFSAVAAERPEPVTASIEVESDRKAGTGSVRAGDFGEARAEPIKNPVDGSTHRARIVLPEGFEYNEAEVANTVTAKVAAGEGEPFNWTLENSYAQLNRFEWSNAG